MKKNLMAALTASSVALMAAGTALVAYVGADVQTESVVKRTSSGTKDGIMLTLTTDEDLYNWRDQVAPEDIEKITDISLGNYYGNNTITKIPDGCFKGLTSLERVIINSSVEEIGAGAFEGCTSLKEIGYGTSTQYKWDPKTQYVGGGYVTVLPYSLKSIGDSAFKGLYIA